MRRWKLLAALLPLVIAIACESNRKSYQRKPPRSYSAPTYSSYSGGSSVPRTSASSLLRQVNLRRDFVRKGSYGRRRARAMRPRYITIHSTQNYSGDAFAHAKALKRGKLGSVIWHYTTQDNVAIQHMPTSEQGIHADHDGPGNHYSIGIEMCEHRGNNRSATIDRTAKLAAYLMKQHNIPIRNVVPHYHWPRYGKRPPNKNCPHFLLTNGRPGATWRAFVHQVNRYYRSIS